MASWLMAARIAHPLLCYFFICSVEVAVIWSVRGGLLRAVSWYRGRRRDASVKSRK